MNQYALAANDQEINDACLANANLNRQYIKKTINDMPKEKRVVCLAAGTTLDEAWPIIKHLQAEGWKLFVGSRVIHCCQYEGVMPDLVFHTDPTDLTDKYWDGVNEEYLSQPGLVCSPIANPNLVDGWKGERYFYWPEEWGDAKNTAVPQEAREAPLYEGGHVGSVTVALPLKWGSEVKMYGYDYFFPGVRVIDPRYGEAVVCFQMYARPIPRTFVGYRNADIIRPEGSAKEMVVSHSYPYHEISPGKFTLDRYLLCQRRLKKTFERYGREYE